MITIAVLATGMMSADNVTVKNDTDTNIYVVVSYKFEALSGSTHKCKDGYASGFIAMGETQGIYFTPCEPGVTTTVYSTTAGKAADMKSLPMQKSKKEIGSMSNASNITVSGAAGTYTVK